ncbi:hypothetical protein SAMN04244560_01023 [Thermoanaerobacter thermohydrosulfuricus]|uniref:Uncharacterized protein n=1 Tax=Thermoanaerobacter thermohydrosulfuricus TaxID=1516 RepID=A0A1G7MU47_THETY|nr:hypothetical protein [Thermoanaerobacter thermohydrosulfuricus]SDF65176.1 hypothetical protein SAMN04244560_01023 [Thermoanaerobacter thermohydrosulfuricus]
MAVKKVSRKFHTYHLELPYINNQRINIRLTVNQKKQIPLKAEIDYSRTTVEPEKAEKLLSDIHWVIKKRNEKEDIISPIITTWEQEDTLIAACLDKKYKVKKASIREQIDLAEDDILEVPDNDRFICWWPDPETWKELEEYLKMAPITELTLPFFSFNEFHKRPDIEANTAAFIEKIQAKESSAKRIENKIKEYKSRRYAEYLHRLKTAALFGIKNNIDVKVTLASVEEALEFFKREKMDPLSNVSWTATTDIFPLMEKYAVEEEVIEPIRSMSGLTAVVYGISYMPKINPVPDAVRIITYAEKKPIFNTIIWFNPIDVETAREESSQIIMDELDRLGVEEIYFEESFLSFKTLA